MKHADTLTRHGTFVKKTVSFDGTKEVLVEMPFGLGDVEWFQRFQSAVPKHLLTEWLMAETISIVYEEKYRDPFCEYLLHRFTEQYDAPFIASFCLIRTVGDQMGDNLVEVTRFRTVVHTRNHKRSPLRDDLLRVAGLKDSALHGEL